MLALASATAVAAPQPATRESRSPAVAVTTTASTPVAVAELLALAQQHLERVHRERLAAAARPVAVAVRWNPRRIATLDVGSSLGAMIAGDLDGDRVPELVLVSDSMVIVCALVDGKLREITRMAFVGEPAAIRPRDPVSTVAIDLAAGEVMAGSSSYATSIRARWQAPTLVILEQLDGLPLCAHQRMRLAVGRNMFVDTGDDPAASAGGKELFFAQRCRDDLTLADGSRASVVARLPVDGPLAIAVQPRCDGPCPSRRYEVSGVGVAFDLGDVDRDGRIDVAYAGAGAPGDPDAVRVAPISDPRRTLYRRAFPTGVAAVALIDFDGNGASEVVAAVRVPGSLRFELWRLN